MVRKAEGPIEPGKFVSNAGEANKTGPTPPTSPVSSEIAGQASPKVVSNVVNKLFPGLSKRAKELLINKTLGIDDSSGPQNITHA